jgi:hypothetical protein
MGMVEWGRCDKNRNRDKNRVRWKASRRVMELVSKT